MSKLTRKEIETAMQERLHDSEIEDLYELTDAEIRPECVDELCGTCSFQPQCPVARKKPWFVVMNKQTRRFSVRNEYKEILEKDDTIEISCERQNENDAIFASDYSNDVEVELQKGFDWDPMEF